MMYTKPALRFKEQADLLISRGLIVERPGELQDFLKQVNYYRLSGYSYIFKQIDPSTGSERFNPGTTFEMIREHYEFDRELRFLLMEALERIEVALFRTRVVEAHTNRYGPFGYALQNNYKPGFDETKFQRLLQNIAMDEERSHEEFIQRYRRKYTSERHLPLWMVAELMSFGQFLTFYRNQHLSFKKVISRQFELFPMVLDSWLLTLNTVRNDCAHYNRLWNRPLPVMPKIPDQKRDERWYKPVLIPNDRIYIVLVMIQYLLGFIAPDNNWKHSLVNMLSAHPDVPHKSMGIPDGWQETPLWRAA